MDKYATGGHYALPIWLDYMTKALKGMPQAEFEAPSEKIVWVDVDGDTGKRATPDTRQPVKEAYLKGNEPPDENGQPVSEAAICEKPPCMLAPKAPPPAPTQANTADQMQKGGL
jgi:membrane carboxypeptidase/penicillin-binding protein